MRIVHTSDWHAGRFWKNVNRLGELADVLEHLGDFIEREQIDLLLHSGDVFDSGAPTPAAERVVFDFLKRVGRAGVPTVLIAGNHDSPARLEAWGALAELVGVQVVARPRRADRGGLLHLQSAAGEPVKVGCVPFAAPRLLVSALELAGDETHARQRYADGLRAVVDNLSAGFTPDAVNLLLLHTHLEGALFSGSERHVHLGDEWAATPQALPAGAHYIALGHIHKPQRLEAAAAPAYYAGSPLQLDFGEAGEEKSFVLADVRPRQPARCERIPYQGGRPLLRVHRTLAQLEDDAAQLKDAGWLMLTIPVPAPDPDLNARVRRLLPNAVRVELQLPERPTPQPEARPPRGASPREMFEAYHRRAHGGPPEATLLAAFEQLREAEEPA